MALIALILATTACQRLVVLAEDWGHSDLAVAVVVDDRLLLTGVDVSTGATRNLADLSAAVDDWTEFVTEVVPFTSAGPSVLAVPSAHEEAQRMVTVDPVEASISVGEELTDIVFPLAGDGWASAVVADGVTVGQIRHGPLLSELDGTDELGFVPSNAAVDPFSGIAAYTGFDRSADLKVAWVDAASGQATTESVAPKELPGGIAIRDGVTAVTVNREVVGDEAQDAVDGSSVRIMDGDDRRALPVPVNPVLVTFVDAGRIAVEGLADDGDRHVVVLDTASGDVTADLVLPSNGRVMGLRMVADRLIAIQEAEVVVLSVESASVETRVALPGRTSMAFLPAPAIPTAPRR